MAEFSSSTTDSKITLFFKGKLDTEAVQEIAEQIELEISNEKSMAGEKLKVVFDIKDVSFVASAFIRTCIKAAKSVSEGSFSILNSSPMIKKTFKIAGLSDILNVS